MKDNKIHYKSSKDIIHFHGIFVLIFYWFFRCINRIFFTRIWNKLSHIKYFHARDATYNKSTAWWQDIGIIIHLILTSLVTIFSFNYKISFYLTLIMFFYLILDMLFFHINVLWFDDLGIGFTEEERMVWSHKRLLFQAIVNFAETIFLFTVIYRIYIEKSFLEILQQSFSIATTLSINIGVQSAPIGFVYFQILISLFYLVVVISVISSMSYSRPEIGKSFDN